MHLLIEKYNQRISEEMDQDTCKCITVKCTLTDEDLTVKLVPHVGINGETVRCLIEDMEASLGFDSVFVQGMFIFTHDL